MAVLQSNGITAVVSALESTADEGAACLQVCRMTSHGLVPVLFDSCFKSSNASLAAQVKACNLLTRLCPLRDTIRKDWSTGSALHPN